MDDDKDWTYGTVLKHPGMNLYAMFVNRRPQVPGKNFSAHWFDAVWLDDRTGFARRVKVGDITLLDGIPTDAAAWIVVE
jgi:hypothetical protein